jgi:predicted Zn-dependent protease
MKTRHTLGIFSFLLLISACASSPTGRNQLILVSDSQMDQMGAESFQAMSKEQQAISSGPEFDYVRCIADAILKADGRDPKSWEVKVFADESPNAFALPGKKIGVHTGMIKLAKNADQLAAVMGHEVGHVDARHGAERVSLAMTSQLAQQATTVLLDGHEYQSTALAALGLGAQFGVLLPYSRTHESEADTIGLYLMAKAGFDPAQAVELWKEMKKASGGKAPPEFMSTHPSNETRINELTKELAHANGVYAAAQKEGRSPSCKRPN